MPVWLVLTMLHLPGRGREEEVREQGGLGFKFRRLRTGLFEVTALKAGGTAARSGLVMQGDKLVAIDGHSTQGLASSDIAVGTQAKCMCLRSIDASCLLLSGRHELNCRNSK